MQVRTRLNVLIASLGMTLAAALLAPGVVNAQLGPPPSVRLDIHGDFGWYNNGGGGFRVDIPVVRDGFLRANGVKDDLSISPGVDLLWWYGRGYEGVGFIPMVMVQWNIYFAEHWSFLAELGIAVLWGPRAWNNRYYSNYVAPVGQLGIRWHFSAANSLFLRVGWPAGAQIGITFDL